MDKYRKIRELGSGTHGIVYLAEVISGERDGDTGHLVPNEVALKKIRMGTAQGLGQEAIRELRLLLEIKHEHIVRVFDVFVKNRSLHIAMERMNIDLEELVRCPALVLNSPLVAAILQPILLASSHLHEDMFLLHRDVKPGNVLLADDGRVCLTDFGLAKAYAHAPPDDPRNERMSPQACTLWYRAPELLFGAMSYGPPADIWSVGCIFAELLLRVPLFAGATELEQLSKIFSIIGTPDEDSDSEQTKWVGMTALLHCTRFKSATKVDARANFRLLLPAVSEDALDLLLGMLRLDPKSRLTAKQALDHPYFRVSTIPASREQLALGVKQVIDFRARKS